MGCVRASCQPSVNIEEADSRELLQRRPPIERVPVKEAAAKEAVVLMANRGMAGRAHQSVGQEFYQRNHDSFRARSRERQGSGEGLPVEREGVELDE